MSYSKNNITQVVTAISYWLQNSLLFYPKMLLLTVLLLLDTYEAKKNGNAVAVTRRYEVIQEDKKPQVNI